MPIRSVKPIDDKGRVLLRKAVIQRARAFLDGYKKPKVINLAGDSEQRKLTEDKL